MTIEFTHIDWEPVKEMLIKAGYEHLFDVVEDMVFVKKGFVP